MLREGEEIALSTFPANYKAGQKKLYYPMCLYMCLSVSLRVAIHDIEFDLLNDHETCYFDANRQD